MLKEKESASTIVVSIDFGEESKMFMILQTRARGSKEAALTGHFTG